MTERMEHMHSFVSSQVLEAARVAAIEIGDSPDQVVRVDVGLSEENPLYISANESLLSVIITRITDEEGRIYFIGYTKE